LVFALIINAVLLGGISLPFYFEDRLMYYHNQHQGKSILSSSRMPISSERHPFLRGNGTGDSGLILSTDAKPRLKWTPDLHERFVEAVNQLGGGDSKLSYKQMNHLLQSGFLNIMY